MSDWGAEVTAPSCGVLDGQEPTGERSEFSEIDAGWSTKTLYLTRRFANDQLNAKTLDFGTLADRGRRPGLPDKPTALEQGLAAPLGRDLRSERPRSGWAPSEVHCRSGIGRGCPLMGWIPRRGGLRLGQSVLSESPLLRRRDCSTSWPRAIQKKESPPGPRSNDHGTGRRNCSNREMRRGLSRDAVGLTAGAYSTG
jgi:hypothetical protein